MNKPQAKIKCPECGGEHGVFFLVRAGGIRDLAYNCDRFMRDVWVDGWHEKHRTTRTRTVPDALRHLLLLAPGKELLEHDLPEQFTPKAAKAANDKNQLEMLPLLKREKPGRH